MRAGLGPIQARNSVAGLPALLCLPVPTRSRPALLLSQFVPGIASDYLTFRLMYNDEPRGRGGTHYTLSLWERAGVRACPGPTFD